MFIRALSRKPLICLRMNSITVRCPYATWGSTLSRPGLWGRPLRPTRDICLPSLTVASWLGGPEQITDLGLLTEVRAVRKVDPSDWSAAYAEGLVHLERSDVASGIALLEESVRLGGDEAVRKTLKAAVAISGNAVRSLGVLEGKTDIVTPAVFTPDERSLLSGTPGKTVGLWDIDARRCIRTLRAPPAMLRQ